MDWNGLGRKREETEVVRVVMTINVKRKKGKWKPKK